MLLVYCGNTANWKAIALMDIRHGERAPHDSRQHSDVGRLLQRLIPANRFKKALICVDHCIRQHARLVCFRNEPAVIVNFFEIHATHLRKLGSPNHPKFDGSRIDDKLRP